MDFVLPKNLEHGDKVEFADGHDYVMSVHDDDDGIWIEWEYGQGGYVHNENTLFKVSNRE